MPEQIIDNDVVDELEKSFFEYSMSVIVSRALPDVRDGLKPVQRRILYAFYRQGMRPGTPYKKSARIVGDIMGKYHPHGDAAIYEALVRLASDEALRLPVIDPHGNFGSLDNPPAASRYTECRLAKAAMPMLEELDEDTVDMIDNYSGDEKVATVLPAGIPYLLVNGAHGIAVGIATYMVPHNLREVISGIIAMADNPKITLEQMMKHIPGPDFPNGGLVLGTSVLKDIYTTGKGKIKLRAKVTESKDGRRTIFTVTELPYLIGPEKIVEDVRRQIANKKLTQIASVNDLTELGTGLRLQIALKTTADPATTLDELYRQTSLSIEVPIQNVALVDNSPKTLGLLELCFHFLEHRKDVVRRRTVYRLDKARARKHIVEGYLTVFAHIAAVVNTIKSSKNTAEAAQNLITKFKLSQVQADSILAMPLARLTSLEVSRYEKERADLDVEISKLSKILNDPKALINEVKAQLRAVAASLGDDRRTQLIEDDVSVLPIKTTITTNKTSKLKNTLWVRDSTGVHQPIDGEPIYSLDRSYNRPYSIFSTGMLAPNLAIGAKAVSLIEEPEKNKKLYIITKLGIIKSIDLDKVSLPPKSAIITLGDSDEVVAATVADDEEYLITITASGKVLAMDASTVRPQGLAGRGILGIKLSGGDHVISFGSALKTDKITFISDAGRIKTSLVADFPKKGRATSGVMGYTFKVSEKCISEALIHRGEVAVKLASGAIIRPDIRISPRASGGSFATDSQEKAVGVYNILL